MDGSKNWLCKRNGHVLGSVERLKYDGHHVERLMLYRHAIDLNMDEPSEVDVIAVIEGFSPTVKCDVPGCGAERTWYPGEGAMQRLLERRKYESV